MTTVLQYLVIAAVIALVLFGVALLLFGRGEQLAALPARTSPAQLPAEAITGTDVRKVRFALAVRGYRMSDVDWTLERLADELDRARGRLAEAESATGAADDATSATETSADSEPADNELVLVDEVDVSPADDDDLVRVEYAGADEDLPAATADEDLPAATADEDLPAATADEDLPAPRSGS